MGITVMNKKLPPFAKKFVAESQRGIKPDNDIFIFLGDDAWRKTRAFLILHWVTLLPNDDLHPENYCWSFVNGNSVLVAETSHTDYQIIRRLAFELLTAKATMVCVIPLNQNAVFFHNRRSEK